MFKPFWQASGTRDDAIDTCQIFYECVSCKTVLHPKPGDCYVFCSYGSVKCPPMQDEN